ncbi:hypothetical protein COO91_09273 (plasmid) [Nostoc flagelliforme CCNUN1]|uniref:Uncharacterized protein n=1 Tax=Nostoc flagelliforme CCNUN1 TaxID=2038116 RepID=A0A2K8T7Q7_9NOSO|nr:hypothetical protein [Nostoc flagelliforme]AUB43115.1 hypothetical protein COO91_09273 [Nostoc flagelliforme CCNUN1]
MQPTISIPQGWKYPHFTLGQRTQQGIIIGIKYYPSDSFLARESDEGWHYVVMPDINSESEENRLENELELLTPQELKTLLEAEIAKHLYQAELLTYELEAIPGTVKTIQNSKLSIQNYNQ